MWTGIGIGGLVGLSGIIYGLWQRIKGADARALAALLKVKLETEVKEHTRTLAAAQNAAEKYKTEQASRLEVINVCEERLQETIERHIADATDEQLLRLGNRVFPPT